MVPARYSAAVSEKVEIVRRANALFNAGHFEGAFEAVHPDVVFRDLQNAPDLPEALRGRESLLHALGHWLDAYDELGVEVENYIEMGSWVIADVRWHGKGRGSDLSVDVRQADACKVQDGMIVEWVIGYPDMETAIEAVGRAD